MKTKTEVAMPELRVVRDVDVEVHDQWVRTQEALESMASGKHADRGVTPRDICERFKTSSKKKLLRALDSVLEHGNNPLFADLTAASVHVEGKPDAWEYVLKLWATRTPRAITEEHLRAIVLWARAQGVEYAGWATSLVEGG